MKKAGLALVLCLAAAAHAQHSFSYTVTVDPSGNADYTTIQGAINSVTSPSIATVILIYAGTYTEEVTLGSTSGNLDLVGVDRDSVIIVAPADKDAVTIKGDGARNNSIRNLTIRTDDSTAGEGRGIVIENNGGADPTDIGISSVTFQIDGASSDAITLADRAHSITISDILVLGAVENNIYGLRVAGGTSGDPSTDITLTDATMLLNGCLAKGVQVDDETEGLTITRLVVRKPAFGGRGVDALEATDLALAECDILAHDGDGLIAGSSTTVRNSSIVVRDDYGSDAGCGSSSADKPAITVNNVSGVLVESSYLEGRLAGVNVTNSASAVVIASCDLRGGVKGVGVSGSSDVQLTGCHISADSDLGEQTSDEHYGVHVVGTTSGVEVTSCEISCRSTTSKDAIGVYVEDAPTDGPGLFSECTVTAVVTSAASGLARGALSDEVSGIALIGGSVTATDEDEREADVYDLYSGSVSQSRILVAGTQFSRWKGAIGAAVGEEVDVLRVVDISAGAATVLATTALQSTEQEIVNNITDPEVFRVLSVTGNLGGMNQTVIIIGRDWALRPIADSITLTGTTTADGVKAFRAVDKIILPARTAIGQTVSIGTSEILGLHSPISETTDLLQIGQKAAAASSYTLQSTVPTPSVERGTVDISSLSPADDDSIEFTYRASK